MKTIIITFFFILLLPSIAFSFSIWEKIDGFYGFDYGISHGQNKLDIYEGDEGIAYLETKAKDFQDSTSEGYILIIGDPSRFFDINNWFIYLSLVKMPGGSDPNNRVVGGFKSEWDVGLSLSYDETEFNEQWLMPTFESVDLGTSVKRSRLSFTFTPLFRWMGGPGYVELGIPLPISYANFSGEFYNTASCIDEDDPPPGDLKQHILINCSKESLNISEQIILPGGYSVSLYTGFYQGVVFSKLYSTTSKFIRNNRSYTGSEKSIVIGFKTVFRVR